MDEVKAQQQAEEEARRLEAEAKRRAEEEQHRKQEEAKARQRAEEERRRQKAESKRRADEEERRKRAEAEARPRAEDERGRQEVEAKLRAEQGQAFAAAIEPHKVWPISSAFLKDWVENKQSARVTAGVAVLASLLLIGVGGYAFLRHSVEGAVQRAELKWEEERRAAEAQVKRKADEAEQQRLAAIKAEQERVPWASRAAAEAEVKRKAEQQFTIRRGIEGLWVSGSGSTNERLASVSFEECEKTCAQRPMTCDVFTYYKITRACFLYSRAELKPNANFDSGVRN